MVPPSKSVRRTSTRSRSSEFRLCSCSASSRVTRGAVVWGEGKASCQGLGASVIVLLPLSDKSECVPIFSFHCVRRAMRKCRSQQCLSRLRSIIEVAAVQPYRTPYGTHLPTCQVPNSHCDWPPLRFSVVRQTSDFTVPVLSVTLQSVLLSACCLPFCSRPSYTYNRIVSFIYADHPFRLRLPVATVPATPRLPFLSTAFQCTLATCHTPAQYNPRRLFNCECSRHRDMQNRSCLGDLHHRHLLTKGL